MELEDLTDSANLGSGAVSSGSWWDSLIDGGGDLLGGAWDWLTDNEDTVIPITSVLGGGLAALLGGDNTPPPTGYQGGIPDYTFNRQQLSQPSGDRRPGSAGRRYFTDGQFVRNGVLDGSNTGIATQTQPAEKDMPQTGPQTGDPNIQETQMYSKGGIATLAGGGYLRGKTNGMEDKIQTTIEGKDPAALSHGEFVVPADVVAFLGGGNNEAGAEKLQQMMDNVRKDATGSGKQIKQIDPNKHLNM